MKNELSLWALDTEDDSKGTVKIINFYDGRKHFTFIRRENAINFILNDIGPSQVWACMAEYDLVNLFGDYMEALCEMTYLKSAFVKARLLTGGSCSRVLFLDTLRHWKLSVRSMGERLGLKKMKFNPNSVRYCRRDTEIVWKWVKSQQRNYEILGTSLRPTIGSSAMSLFKSKFQKDTTEIKDPKARAILQEAVRGGRVEIFKTGIVHGNIQCFDVNGMYPSVMQKMAYPCLRNYIWTESPDFNREGVAELLLDYPLQTIPCLPFYRKKLIFPTGKLRGTWCYPEIRQAILDGARISRIYRAIEFPNNCKPFSKYIKYLYEKRLKTKDILEKETLKLFMNNLFGKFGQKNGLELWRGCQIEERNSYSRDANMVWAAYTTCYARLELLGLLRQAGSSLLYCDTDSLFTLDGLSFPIGEGLGQLKHVGTWKTAHFVLPKCYMLDNGGEKKFKTKGVPQKAAQKFFETYEAEYESPIRFRESFRRHLPANYWIKKTRSLNQKYDKRIALENGNTEPIRIK